MHTLDSNLLVEPDEIRAQERAPLAGEDLDAAIKAMESKDFLAQLTGRIMQQARKMGFQSTFSDSMNLPGGKSAGDLASEIVEKAMMGNYKWNREKDPDFAAFCHSRARSILSNWLERTKHYTTFSPLPQEDAISGDPVETPITRAVAPEDLYAILRAKEGGDLGDKFLEDFALSLPDGSVEQRIVMAVFDDRECGNRAYCRGKLNLSESDYDAAVKRLLRRLQVFGNEWRANNKISAEEWKEAR